MQTFCWGGKREEIVAKKCSEKGPNRRGGMRRGEGQMGEEERSLRLIAAHLAWPRGANWEKELANSLRASSM